MEIEEKLALVVRITDSSTMPNAEFFRSVANLTNDVYDHVADGGNSSDGQYGSESYGESLIRYHRLGYITDDQIEELWMRAVLAGLHNKLEEQDDASR